VSVYSIGIHAPELHLVYTIICKKYMPTLQVYVSLQYAQYLDSCEIDWRRNSMRGIPLVAVEFTDTKRQTQGQHIYVSATMHNGIFIDASVVNEIYPKVCTFHLSTIWVSLLALRDERSIARGCAQKLRSLALSQVTYATMGKDGGDCDNDLTREMNTIVLNTDDDVEKGNSWESGSSDGDTYESIMPPLNTRGYSVHLRTREKVAEVNIDQADGAFGLGGSRESSEGDTMVIGDIQKGPRPSFSLHVKHRVKTPMTILREYISGSPLGYMCLYQSQALTPGEKPVPMYMVHETLETVRCDVEMKSKSEAPKGMSLVPISSLLVKYQLSGAGSLYVPKED